MLTFLRRARKGEKGFPLREKRYHIAACAERVSRMSSQIRLTLDVYFKRKKHEFNWREGKKVPMPSLCREGGVHREARSRKKENPQSAWVVATVGRDARKRRKRGEKEEYPGKRGGHVSRFRKLTRRW